MTKPSQPKKQSWPQTSKTPWQHHFWRVFYDHAAFAYDATLRLADLLHFGSEERIRREFLTGLELKPRARILEIGCGTAANRAFLPTESTYIGLDLSQQMLRRAKKKCSEAGLVGHFVRADALRLPVDSETVDLAFAMGVIQHLAYPIHAGKELVRTVKPGAQLLLIDESRTVARLAGFGQSLVQLSAKLKEELHLKSIARQWIGEYFILLFAKAEALPYKTVR